MENFQKPNFKALELAGKYQIKIGFKFAQKHLTLMAIKSLDPGKGNLKGFMGELLEFLDEEEISCSLNPAGTLNADVSRITQFYIRLGFKPNSSPHHVIHDSLIRVNNTYKA